MVDSALACGKCGAGLPPPGSEGTSVCIYCGAERRVPSGRRDAERSASAIAESSSPHGCEEAARIPLTEDAVLHLLRQHFVDAASIFVCPHVPPSKERAARRAHVVHLPERERVLALYDTSGVLDGGHEGFVVTAKRVCWKNAGEPACSMQWRDLDPDLLCLDGQRLYLDEDAIVMSETEIQDACANAFHILALSGLPPRVAATGRVLARDTAPDLEESEVGPTFTETTETFDHDPEAISLRRSATPPPPHTTSYFAYASHAQRQTPDCSCWHCHTPLYEKTPQCAFCGAEPTPTGWLRTG